MYHREIVDRRIHQHERETGKRLKRWSLEDSIARQSTIASIEKKGRFKRDLRSAEIQFIANELALSQLDFHYWVERYAYLNTKAGSVERIRFWQSQKIALQHIAEGELRAWKESRDNLWCWGKARQLGATQVAQSLIAHRVFLFHNQRAAIAADNPQKTIELSRRLLFIHKKLPFWMRPTITENVKGAELQLAHLNSGVTMGYGSAEGGGLAQGQTTNVFHLTELPDWVNFGQIDEDFLPTVPLIPTSCGFAESTARGKGDAWHEMFELAWKGQSRWQALFIPWYAEEDTYSLKPPEDWKPGPLACAHAEKVERQSPEYCFGKTVKLTKGQLYWWQSTYSEYRAKGKLHIFFQEFASDHQESFQSATVSLFSHEILGEIRQNLQQPTVYQVIGG